MYIICLAGGQVSNARRISVQQTDNAKNGIQLIEEEITFLPVSTKHFLEG